ncbi:MAG: hypothetical protein AB7K04_10365 [Pseudorhodoplanes sp.]
MVSAWSVWRPCPMAQGGRFDAPAGPGVYEVRHTETGELVAFGEAAQVAHDLDKLMRPAAPWSRLLGAKELRHPAHRLEYRTRAAASANEARILAAQLRERRQTFWRRWAS